MVASLSMYKAVEHFFLGLLNITSEYGKFACIEKLYMYVAFLLNTRKKQSSQEAFSALFFV